ncbi:MAG TPA: SUMF1/EgtB/PvdO family nonheme iron enzyme [Sorangium sp.]|nr:SUMF1/EgtB/PvdO family nonheme iron enzyme [Sorangium sp.]
MPPSCAGLPETCGARSDESCCAGTKSPGGAFNRDNDVKYPSVVSEFVLDKFELTVGRFRKFVEAYPGSKPILGAGAHPKIEGSGWDTSWEGELPTDAAALKTAIKCDISEHTWTDEIGDHENLPNNCLSWYVAFAFCAWDGGRLPTEAEWNYAAAGGEEQRPYPWSSSSMDDRIDASHAVYDCLGDGSAFGVCAFSDIQRVGSRSMTGDGKWGQADLAGNMWEWTMDRYADYMVPCDDCANITSQSNPAIRGGSWNNAASNLFSKFRTYEVPSSRQVTIGARCARSL